MPVAPDLNSLTTAAEQAASSGDFATAARYLEQGVALQEAEAGSMPAELANTLNNLGVVYEQLDRPAEAERCYRRAHAVARAVLPAEHPSLALSEKNLRDFCEGRGIPVDEPPAVAPAVAPESPPAAAPPVSAAESGTPRRRAPVLTGIAVVAFGALALLGIRSFGTPDVPEAPAMSSAPSTPAAEPPPPTPMAPAPAPQPESPPLSSTPAAASPAPERAARAAVVPTVVTAAVCGSLETSGAEWQCAPPTGEPGTFFFYTRLAAPEATTVEHRWYRDGRLHQAISLRVSPNLQRGYRTYSRIAIGSGRAGAWRAELRSSSGAILHTEQFSVAP